MIRIKSKLFITLARNGCLDSNCASNAACRHGPNGWGCTCDCGYQGDGKSQVFKMI